MDEEIEREMFRIRYRQSLILSALRNLLSQNNPNGVNDYLIEHIVREL